MNIPNQIVSVYEQLETEVTQAAKAIGSYHFQLSKERIPSATVETLTLEFARQWWTSQLGLNEQHVYMHGDEEGDE